MNGRDFLKARVNELKRISNTRADDRIASTGINQSFHLNPRDFFVVLFNLLLDNARVSNGDLNKGANMG